MRLFGTMGTGSKGEGVIDRERPFGYISFRVPRGSVIHGDSSAWLPKLKYHPRAETEVVIKGRNQEEIDYADFCN